MAEKCTRKDGEKFETQFRFFQTFFMPSSAVIFGEKCDGKYRSFFTAFCGVHTSEKVKTFLKHVVLGNEVKNSKYWDSSFSVENVKFFISSFPAQNSSVFQVEISVKNLKPRLDLEQRENRPPVNTDNRTAHRQYGCLVTVHRQNHLKVFAPAVPIWSGLPSLWKRPELMWAPWSLCAVVYFEFVPFLQHLLQT